MTDRRAAGCLRAPSSCIDRAALGRMPGGSVHACGPEMAAVLRQGSNSTQVLSSHPAQPPDAGLKRPRLLLYFTTLPAMRPLFGEPWRTWAMTEMQR